MTPNREDYLKIIHSTNLRGEKISNKFLAEELSISAPSVSEMLRKLIKAGVVIKDKNLGYSLSAGGVVEAQRLLNIHRLWEVFLIEHLGYQWDEVHNDAEVLEHATSDFLLSKLNKFLKYPQHCPHGSVIFGNEVFHTSLIPLNQVAIGQTFMLKSINENSDLKLHLVSRNVKIDKKYKLVGIDDFDQSFEMVDENQNKVIISKRAGVEIYVEIINE